MTDRIFGRDKERDVLLRALDSVREGAKRALVFMGEPGVGKSVLLRHAAAVAIEDGCTVSVVRATTVSGAAHSPVLQCLEGIAVALRRAKRHAPVSLHRAMEALRGDQPSKDPRALLPMVAEALEAVAQYAPVALLVDDYHRAPGTGTDFLIAILRAVEGPFFMGATARLTGDEEPASSQPPHPAADLWVDHVLVEGLSREAIIAVAEQQLGGPVLPSLGDALAELTLGNPLYVEELLRSWQEQGRLETVGSFWTADDEALHDHPRSLAGMIADRLDALDDAEREVAGVLAIIGRDARFDELRAVVGWEQDALVRTMERLRELGLCHEDLGPPITYRLAHPLHEAALVSRLSATVAGAIHGRLCHALRNAPKGAVVAAEIAHHASRALERPADLPALLRRAAEEAEAARSLAEAAFWWESLEAECLHDPELRLVAVEGRARTTAGFDAGAAVGHYTQALGVTDDDETRHRLLRGRAQAYRRLGSLKESADDLTAALCTATQPQRVELECAIALNKAMQGQLGPAERRLRSLEDQAKGSPEWPALLGHVASLRYVKGDVAGAAELCERSLALTDPLGSAQLRGNLMWLYVLLGRWDEGLELVADLVERGSGHGDSWHAASPLAAAARIYAWRGEIARGIDMANRAARIAERLGSTGDHIDALDALTVALLCAGTPKDAADVAARIPILCSGCVEQRADFAVSFVVAGEAHLQAGDPAAADDLCSVAAEHVGSTAWAVAVDRLRARIRLQTRDGEGALAELERWVQKPSPLVVEQAFVWETYGRALLHAERRTDGVAAVERALLTYRDLGAASLTAPVETWLSKHKPRPIGRPRSNLPGGLTPRETEVLRLAIQGLTNSQMAEIMIVSTPTVRKHMENLMRKAGVSRRTQLLDFAASIGIKLGYR